LRLPCGCQATEGLSISQNEPEVKSKDLYA
jgi:hypothetical protein